MQTWALSGEGGQTGLNQRQMVAARDGGLIEPCTKHANTVHPVPGMRVDQIMEILAMQPELFDCTFCTAEPTWQYSYDRYVDKALKDPEIRDLGLVAQDGPGYPFVVCDDCHLLIETGDARHLAERQMRHLAERVPHLGDFDHLWSQHGHAIVVLAREAIAHRHVPVPFDPERWRRGEVKPIDWIEEPVGPPV